MLNMFAHMEIYVNIHTHHAERVRDPDGVRLHDGVAVHMDRGGRGEERRGEEGFQQTFHLSSSTSLVLFFVTRPGPQRPLVM